MTNPAHFDYDTLADLAEGLLEDDQAASVNAHLETCAECRDRSADLADVSRLLAEAPVPAMPAELASRIDSAIAAESLHSATVVSLEQRRGRRPWRILSAAAATVVVLGGGAMVGTAVLDGDNSGDSAAKMPATDPGSNAAPTQRLMGAAPPFTVAHSGTDYRPGQVGAQVRSLLGKGQELRTQGDQPSAVLRGCVDALANGRRPELVDRARYKGAPALVVALPGTKSGTLDLMVVGANCTAQDHPVLEQSTAAAH
ncbi:hypothetical protein [Actinomadura macrotermitis]|uniref:Zinc-finger domain-containing protein n=1 Tax=Actinomadura macrotermitis TaxID=2585200 RepID=A0A7K0BVV9_9ACTN|nr:hypothetical protein [Actinomadura macrotermitis]MQY05297.1 hypothetical protein [Actinomadura macrotermitis]